MKKEIKKNDLGGLIIDRAKSNEEASGQIDTLAKEFHVVEEGKERIESPKERDVEIIPAQKKKVIHFTKRNWRFQERRNDPESKEEKRRYHGKLKWI